MTSTELIPFLHCRYQLSVCSSDSTAYRRTFFEVHHWYCSSTILHHSEKELRHRSSFHAYTSTGTMSDSDGLRNPLSLQEQCLTYIILHLEHIPPSQLALLPPHFTKYLVSRLPLLDLLRLENSAFAVTTDFREFWSSVCTRDLRQNSAESFYLECRKWLKAFGVQSNSSRGVLSCIHDQLCSVSTLHAFG